MEFGTLETKRVIDQEGSIETVLENIRGGLPVSPVRRRYEIRKQVSAQSEELSEYIAFSDEFKAKPNMMDIDFKVERAKPGKKYYYVICCYTLLEY